MSRKALLILSYNHIEQTRQCLEAASRHQRWPVILVHNGSRPDIVQKLSQDWPNIEHVILEQNIGFAGGMNAGLTWAFERMDKVLAITNDTQLLSLPPDLPDGIGVPVIYRRKMHYIDSCGGRLTLWRGHLQHLRSVEEFQRWSKTPYFYVPGTAFALDRATWQTVGPFDQELFCLWEDVDWSLRAHRAGIAKTLMTECQLLHKVGKTMHRKSYYTSYLFQRNRRLIMQRYARNGFERLLQKLVLSLEDRRSKAVDPERHFWQVMAQQKGPRLAPDDYQLVNNTDNR